MRSTSIEGSDEGPLHDAFQRDGVVLVRNFLQPEEVETLRRGIDAVLASPSPLFIQASAPDDPGRFVEDFCNWRRIDEIRTMSLHPKIARVAAALMGSQIVRLYHDHVLVKSAGTRQETPWHQDQPYYNIDGFQNCSTWAPVDHVARASTLEFVRGSHRHGWYTPRAFLSHEAKWFREGSLAEVPPIESRRELFDIVGWEMHPGDVVFFHMLTLHHSYGVPLSDGSCSGQRRAFSLRFVGDDVTMAPRPWKTSPPFDELQGEGGLSAGSPLDHPLFPVVYRSEV